jgi:ribonucleoside-diphosphate reductase alpha chain
MVTSTHALGEPGYLFRDAINRTDPDKHLGEIVTTNPCVIGSTIIVTREGDKRIDACVDKEIEVWNGFEWSTVTPKLTGVDQEVIIVRFALNAGLINKSIICTPYHIFPTISGKKQAKDLKIGDIIEKYSLPQSKHLIENDVVVTGIAPNMGFAKKVYCLTEPKNHTFIANGILTGNCGEIPIRVDQESGGGESCNLGSIDLSKFIVNDVIDFKSLEHSIRDGVGFLNKVIDKNKYPFPEIEKLTKDTRKTGLGWMGVADAFIKLNLPYDSQEAKGLAQGIEKFMNDTAVEESMKLAGVIGCYPKWEGSEWQKKGIPMANSTLTCNAPTGSISIFADCSPGIEPVFSFVYTRKNCVGKEFYVVHPLFDKRLREVCMDLEYGDEEKARDRYAVAIELCHKNGSIQNIDWLPPEFRAVFKTAMDISAKDHVDMQAAFQKNCGNSISKTINLRPEATIREVGEIILYAWKSECKGITLYRQGSRDIEVMTLSKEQKDVQIPQPYVRPEWLRGFIGHKKSGCGEIWIVIGYDTVNGV